MIVGPARLMPTKETQKDWSAVLQRAEQIVQHLRGRTFVRDGFELDEIGAERMLLWCRARVAREPEPDPDPEFQAVADFLFAHGHSLQVPLSERVVFCRDRRLFDKQRHVPGW